MPRACYLSGGPYRAEGFGKGALPVAFWWKSAATCFGPHGEMGARLICRSNHFNSRNAHAGRSKMRGLPGGKTHRPGWEGRPLRYPGLIKLLMNGDEATVFVWLKVLGMSMRRATERRRRHMKWDPSLVAG